MANTPKNSPKKQINVKLALIIIVSVLVAALITSNVMLTLKVVGIFDKDPQTSTETPSDPIEDLQPEEELPPVDDVTALPENIIYGLNADGNIAVTFASTAEDSESDVETNVKRIIAKVEPENAPQGTVWSIAWKNAESEWASDKDLSDYASLDNYSNVGTVRVFQPFSEQIVVKIVSEEDESKFATVTVDYIKSYTLPSSDVLSSNIRMNKVVLDESEGTLTGELNIEWVVNFTPIIDLYKASANELSQVSKLKESSVISGMTNTNSFDLALPDTSMVFNQSNLTGLQLSIASSTERATGLEKVMYGILFESEYVNSFSSSEKNSINTVLQQIWTVLKQKISAVEENASYPYLEVKVSHMESLHTYRYYFSVSSPYSFPNNYVDDVETDQSGGIIFG